MFYEDSKSINLFSFYLLLEIGIGLICLGLMIYSIGVFMFLDRGLLAIGNVRNHMPLIIADIILDGSSLSRWV